MSEVSAVRAKALSRMPSRVDYEETWRRWEALKTQRSQWEFD